jgi:hypothetical protein
MTTMCEVSNNIKIGAAGAHVPRVPIRDVEPFDRPVVPGSADLGFAGATTSGEDHGPDRVEMTAQTKFELEVGAFSLGTQRVEREFVVCAPPTGH